MRTALPHFSRFIMTFRMSNGETFQLQESDIQIQTKSDKSLNEYLPAEKVNDGNALDGTGTESPTRNLKEATITESPIRTPKDRTRSIICLQLVSAVLAIIIIVMAATFGSLISELKKQAEATKQATDELQTKITHNTAATQRLNEMEVIVEEMPAAFQAFNATVIQADSDGKEGRAIMQQHINNITTTNQNQQTRIDGLESYRRNFSVAIQEQSTRISHLEGTLQTMNYYIEQLLYHTSGLSLPRDCYDVSFVPNTRDGTYTIYPYGTPNSSVTVYCTFDSDGAWTVIQRRFTGALDFYRPWSDYKTGFGTANKEYWLGNDFIYELTTINDCEIKFILTAVTGKTRYASYTTFYISDETEGYKLTIEGFSGNAGNSMEKHNGMKFTTYDRDNDTPSGNCAETFHGAWWYWDCLSSNLNGRYYSDGRGPNLDGISWSSWIGFGNNQKYSLTSTTMKIKRK